METPCAPSAWPGGTCSSSGPTSLTCHFIVIPGHSAVLSSPSVLLFLIYIPRGERKEGGRRRQSLFSLGTGEEPGRAKSRPLGAHTDFPAHGARHGCTMRAPRDATRQADLCKEMETTRVWPYMGPFSPPRGEQTLNPGLRSCHIWKDTREGAKKIYDAQPSSLPVNSPERGENDKQGVDQWHSLAGGRSCPVLLASITPYFSNLQSRGDPEGGRGVLES